MPAAIRLELNMTADDRRLVAQAAALTGTSVAGFIRAACREKAAEVLEREQRITLGSPDLAAMTNALDAGFRPNAALNQALAEADRTVK